MAVGQWLRRKLTMLNLLRSIRFGAVVIATAAVLVSATSRSYAETGTLRVSVAKAGFIFGVGGGTGILRFRGKDYPLRIEGFSAGTIGVARADLVGVARNLRTASDIVGSYSAVSAGVSVAGGAKSAKLQNSKGVVLELRGTQVGFEASLNLAGVTIAMQ
jgi:hypothetical protein